MRTYKNNIEPYIKSILIFIFPIILLYFIWQYSPRSLNIISKTALLSASFENPSHIFVKIKNKLSDITPQKSIVKNFTKEVDEEIANNKPEIIIQENDPPNTQDIDQDKCDEDVVEFIPEEYRGIIIEEQFQGGSLPLYINIQPGYLSNRTKINSQTLIDQINNMPDIKMTLNDQPQVLLFSTHATESFEPYDRKIYDKRYNSRSTDNDKNVTKIEDKIAEQLRNHGINTIVDKTQHDFPSYNGSYNRSAQTINNYLKNYPSIKVILDIHRDAIERDNGERVKPVTSINNQKAAQIMIISGCDDGSMNFPNWAQNLNFAIDLQNQLEEMYPTLTRPIFFCYRKYNMNICPCSLLIEFGSNSNTLNEVLYSGELMGNALSELLLSYTK